MCHFWTGSCCLILLCTLLKSNQMTFLVELGDNIIIIIWTPSVFQKAQITILILFEKPIKQLTLILALMVRIKKKG